MSKKPRVVFLDHASLDRQDLDLAPLRAVSSELTLHASTLPDEVAERMAGYEVVITNKVRIDEATLRANSQLNAVLVAATGMNNVDLAAGERLGIKVLNCRGYGTSAVAQHTLMLMLALVTRFESYRRAVNRGDWQRSSQFCLLDYPIEELSGARLGILGYGELGRAVGRLAEAFGMEIIVGSLPGREQPGRPPLAELLEQVDLLSLHCPLTDTTRNLIGAPELARMKPGSLLINTARGGLVDEQALVESLRSGHLGGAAFDVLSSEPPTEGNPLLAAEVPNLIVTPHCAWGSRPARQRIVGQLAGHLSALR
jgi:glycerate dehydrogenase